MTIVLVSVALAVLLAAQALYHSIGYARERKRGELRRRLKALSGEGQSPGLLRTGRMARSPAAARAVSRLPLSKELERLLIHTDLEWTVAGMLRNSLLTGFGVAVFLRIVLPLPLFLLLLLVPAALGVSIFLALAARVRRCEKISEQLPDALDMMVRSLRAGHGVSSGFRLVTSEMPVPIAVEFGRCFEEQQAGASMRDAVRNMTERVPGNLDLRIFATSLVIQHETGGNLVEILEKISAIIRDRYKFFGRLRAVTSEARMSGRILAGLPFACAVLVAILNFEYMRPLFVDPLGHVIVLGGLVLWGAGVLWMRRLAQVEF